MWSAIQRDPSLASLSADDKIKYTQKIYITFGCDYVSFWVGHGKVSFLNAFFNHAEFLSDNYLPGKLSNYDDSNILFFYWLICCVYFKQANSENKDFTLHMALYNIVRGEHPKLSHLETHMEWLHIIRNAARVGKTGEENVLPHYTVLSYHWQRTNLVSLMNNSCTQNIIPQPQFDQFGYTVINNRLEPT